MSSSESEWNRGAVLVWAVMVSVGGLMGKGGSRSAAESTGCYVSQACASASGPTGENFTGALRKPAPASGEHPALLSRLADNGDLCDLVAMREQELQVTPIAASFPALEVFQDGEDAWLHSGIDIAGGRVLHLAEFGSLHMAAEAQDIRVIGFALDASGHGDLI